MLNRCSIPIEEPPAARVAVRSVTCATARVKPTAACASVSQTARPAARVKPVTPLELRAKRELASVIRAWAAPPL